MLENKKLYKQFKILYICGIFCSTSIVYLKKKKYIYIVCGKKNWHGSVLLQFNWSFENRSDIIISAGTKLLI